MNYWLLNEEETRQAGAALATDLLPLATTAPVVIFVRGDLGAGKSTFVRGFLSQAGVTGVMPSPTYSLVEPYETDALRVFHMDAYRIADGAELDYLGLDEIDRPGSVLLVEWPDQVKDELPPPTATVDLWIAPHPDSRAIPEHATPGQAQAPASGQTAFGQAHGQAPEQPHCEGASGQPRSPVPEPGSVGRHAHSADRDLSEKSDINRDLARYSSQVGRALRVTLGAVPVHEGAGSLQSDFFTSGGWRGLHRVVT